MAAKKTAAPPSVDRATCDEAIEHARRLLGFAEDETDLAKMERYERLADSWTTLANLLNEREHV